jgi:hypothetical protein
MGMPGGGGRRIKNNPDLNKRAYLINSNLTGILQTMMVSS